MSKEFANTIEGWLHQKLATQVLFPSFDELVEFLESINLTPFKTRKAAIEWIMSREADFFPEEIVINRRIVAIGQSNLLRFVIEEAIKRGLSPGVRTCSMGQLGKSPWVMGLSSENLDRFMENVYPS